MPSRGQNCPGLRTSVLEPQLLTTKAIQESKNGDCLIVVSPLPIWLPGTSNPQTLGFGIRQLYVTKSTSAQGTWTGGRKAVFPPKDPSPTSPRLLKKCRRHQGWGPWSAWSWGLSFLRLLLAVVTD